MINLLKALFYFLVGLANITWTYLKKIRESISIAMGLWFLIYIAPKVREFDPGAAPVDLGVLISVAYGIVALLILKRTVWWIINMIWPMFATYSNNKFETDFNNLDPWQRVKTYLFFYLSLAGVLAFMVRMFI